jgi:pimeloyl-ACP methyl ester carboxylesterase
MTKFLTFGNIRIRYKSFGNGHPVVLLHGYLEALESWDDFAAELESTYQVITIDLPGHAESTNHAPINTMDDMADGVYSVLQHLKIDKCVLVGHSMGGYATLAFAEKYPEMLAGFCLFHSSPLPDNEEKLAARDREIQLVRDGRKTLLYNTNIPKMFANDNLEPLKDKVIRAKEIASKTNEDGIISALEGMKLRPERTEVLDTDIPKLFILGKKDNYIPFEKMFPVLDGRNHGEVVALENSGHMGFIEEKEKSVQVIRKFLEKVY